MSKFTQAALMAVSIASATVSSTALAAPKLPSAPYLPLELAQKAANSAMAKCLADGQNVSVAVVDRSGNTRVLLKSDQSGPHTVGSSTGKAFTSASMGRPTSGLANFLKDHRELDGLRDMDSRLVILAGGLPIKIGDALIGGIGVGGAPSGMIDEACAQAGVDAITR